MNKYIELMEELLEAGDLPEEVEADYAQRLDDIYWKLTNSEQDFLEKKLNVSIRMIKKGICQRCGAFGLNKKSIHDCLREQNINNTHEWYVYFLGPNQGEPRAWRCRRCRMFGFNVSDGPAYSYGKTCKEMAMRRAIR